MKNFFIKYKKQILKILLLLVIVIVISLLTFLILLLCNIIYIDETGFNFNIGLFNNIKNTWYGYIIFILLETILTILLCVIPGTSMAFIMLGIAIYGANWQTFILCIISVFLSSFVMYVIGRFGGYKICSKLIGEEDSEKATDLLRTHGTIYFPLFMIFGGFPDDALVMIAGVTKMKLIWFIPSIIIGRGIGVATIVFGINLIPYTTFTTFYDWLVCGATLIIYVVILFYLAHKINIYIEKHRNKK